MAETKMQLVDWLDDLCVRFLINLPAEELQSVERICFQIEEAQWFYEDFIRLVDPTLPSLPLKQFVLAIFQHCPLFDGSTVETHVTAFEEFLMYKTRVPVRGAIMLDETMQEVLLVKGWKKGANWSFPRGKINKDEDDLDCAVREVYEETGFDVAAAGLIPNRNNVKSIDVTLREQHMKLFVIAGVPKDTLFQPRTRKEISKIQWYKLANLPGYNKKVKSGVPAEETIGANKLYMVAPFLSHLRKWVNQQRRQIGQPSFSVPHADIPASVEEPETDGNFTADEEQRNPSSQYEGSATPAGHRGFSDPDAELRRLLASGSASISRPDQDTMQDESAANANRLLALFNGGQATPATSHNSTRISDMFFEPPVQASAQPPSSGHNQQYPTSPQQQQRLPQPSAQQQGLLSLFQRDKPTLPTRTPSGFEAPIPSDPVTRHPLRSPDPTSNLQASDLATVFPIGARVPAPSQLPQPQLSSHAQGLLSLFQNKVDSRPTPGSSATQPFAPLVASPSPAAPMDARPIVPKRSSLSMFQPSSVVARRKDSQTSARRSPQPQLPTASAVLPQAVQTATSPPFARSASSNSPIPISGTSRQAQNLLNIFKKAPAGTDSPELPTSQDFKLKPAVAPVELAAIKSPRMPPAEMPAHTASAELTRTPKAMSILQRPKSHEEPTPLPAKIPRTPEPQHSYRTLASPQSGAEQSTTRRQRQRHKHKSSEGRSSVEGAQQTPIQILKRPQQPSAENAGLNVTGPVEPVPSPKPQPRAERHNATPTAMKSPSRAGRSAESRPGSSRNKQPPKSAFQPTILKRPPQESSGQPTSPQPMNVTMQEQQDRTAALLALLGSSSAPEPTIAAGSKIAASENARPPKTFVEPPVIEAANQLAATLDTRDSSAASSAAGPQAERSSVSYAGGKDSSNRVQSPISPADKGFLLSYLNGVMKGAQK